MPQKMTLDALAKKVQGQKDRHEHLEKEVRALKDLLNVHDNWHAEIRSWIGRTVSIVTVNGKARTGLLLWSDRYNLCIQTDGCPKQIYNKGAVVSIELYEG